MNRLKTPNYYIEAAKQEWKINKDICTYNPLQKELESSTYAAKEIFRDLTGENIDTHDALDVSQYVGNRFKDTVTTGLKTLHTKKEYEKLLEDMAKKSSKFSRFLGAWNYYSKIQDFLKLEELFVNIFQRNETIENICKPVMPKEVNDNLKLLLEKIKKDPGVKFDKVAPPRRLKAPDLDNINGRTMVA